MGIERGQGYYFRIEDALPKGFQDRARTGALAFRTAPGIEGVYPWLSPIDGHPKLIAPKNPVVILSLKGEVLYQGVWSEIPDELVEQNEKLFVHLPYPQGRTVERPGLLMRLQGAWRWLKHRKKK